MSWRWNWCEQEEAENSGVAGVGELGEKIPPNYFHNFLFFHIFTDGLFIAAMGNVHLGNLP